MRLIGEVRNESSKKYQGIILKLLLMDQENVYSTEKTVMPETE